MSRRNQSRRRRSYGRRQHELGERRTQHEVRWTPYEWSPRDGLGVEHIDDLAADEPRALGA